MNEKSYICCLLALFLVSTSTLELLKAPLCSPACHVVCVLLARKCTVSLQSFPFFFAENSCSSPSNWQKQTCENEHRECTERVAKVVKHVRCKNMSWSLSSVRLTIQVIITPWLEPVATFHIAIWYTVIKKIYFTSTKHIPVYYNLIQCINLSFADLNVNI